MPTIYRVFWSDGQCIDVCLRIWPSIEQLRFAVHARLEDIYAGSVNPGYTADNFVRVDVALGEL